MQEFSRTLDRSHGLLTPLHDGMRANVSGRFGLSLALSLFGLLLAVGTAHAAFPGKNGKVAYTAGTNQIFLTGSGQLTFPPPLIADGSPAFSPDGSRVAFLRSTPVATGYRYQLMTVKSDGTGLTQVTDSTPFASGGVVPFSSVTSPTWHRRGQRISFFVGAGPSANHGIWTAGGPAGLVQTVQSDDARFLQWSPTTDELVYTCRFRPTQIDLCVFDEATGATRQLPVDWEGLSSVGIGEPKWTPDGEKIVFFGNYLSSEGGGSHVVSRYDIFTINADGGALGKLSDSGPDLCPDRPAGAPTYVFQSPSPSPDGGSIAAYRLTNVRAGSPSNCGILTQERGLYSLAGELVVADSLLRNGIDWQPTPVDVLFHIDDGYDHPLKGLKVELRTLQDVVAYDQPVNSEGGSYAFDSVVPGDYLVRITLIDTADSTGITPDFEIRNGLTEPDAVWIEKRVEVIAGEQKLERISFKDSIGITSTSIGYPEERERLDDLANIFYRLRQYVDWVKSRLTTNTGAEVIFYAYAETSLDGTGTFAPDDAVYIASESTVLLGTAVSDYSARDARIDEGPENVEWHEFTHHLFRTHVDMSFCSPGSVNHAGYANPDTCDSMNEGFADFLPTLAARDIDHVTDSIFANLVDLEDNVNAWVFRGHAAGDKPALNWEDLAVAALFWDLVDTTSDSKSSLVVAADGTHQGVIYTDQTSESIASLWTRMTTGSGTATVRALRLAYGQPPLTLNLDPGVDALVDVAPIDIPFLMHGFYPVDGEQAIPGFHSSYHYDVARAQQATPSVSRNDAVGLSSHQAYTELGVVSDTYIPREHLPRIPNANVAIDVLDASGTPIANAAVEVVVQTGSQQTTSTRRLDGGNAALMYLELPTYFDYLLPVDAALPPCNPPNDIQATATLRVTVNGFPSVQPATVLDNCTHVRAAAAATGPAASFLTATFPEDSTAPTSTISSTPTEPLVLGVTPGAWKIGLSCSDPPVAGFASGCARIEYQLDGGPITSYRERVEVAGSGRHAFAYRSVDAAANEEPFRSITLDVAVPEPDSIPALIAGLAALQGLARRRWMRAGR